MPTLRQKAAFEKILENPRPIGTVMREVGYSENTIVDPQNLTKSKGWLELVAEYLPDNVIAERHRELLDKREVVVVRDGKESRVELTDQPHSDVKGALDMAYKLKGSYAPDKSVTVNLDVNYQPKDKKIADKYEEELRRGILGENFDTPMDSETRD